MSGHRFRTAFAVTLCGALALALANPASAFVRIARQASPTSPVVQAHWNNDELPLQSVVNPTNNDKTNAVALASIMASAESWEDITTSFFTVNPTEFLGPPDLVPALANDGQNSVIFDPTGANFPTPGVIAFVRSILDGTDGHTLDADMVFNDRDFWWSTSPALEPPPAGQSSVDLQSVATHEYGHYFSLDHTSILGATMIPFIQSNISQRTLELDDRAGNSTVYPEASFLSDYGSISGTCLNGFSGLALFGAHVEALLDSDTSPANAISAISGEITLRNGQGEYTIHGLPPGDYRVRIVPLDGIHTTAADANIGGPYNGLDIDFETEFWNGADEGADGFTDLAADYDVVGVTAGQTTSGINFQSNTFAGRVIIAQHGAFENVVGFRSTGYLAVRFDPPFDAAYTIQNIEFPSFTFNGIPATFLSAKLCVLNTATGLPDIASPLVNLVPFVGSPNGVNTVPLNLAGTVGQTYFWVLEFPNQATTPGFPFNFPFVRMDFVQLERGHFANSYTIPLSGPGAGIVVDRNFTVTMQCQLDPSEVPIEAASNLGGNRTATNMEFGYTGARDIRADKFGMPNNSVEQTELIARSAGAPGTYSFVAAGGAGSGSIKLDPQPSNTVPAIYSTRVLDKNGNYSLPSNVTIPGLAEGPDEPNGRLNQAIVLTTPVVNRPENCGPAGDQDYFSVMAAPGEKITASATHVGALDGRNDPDYVMFLYDHTGALVAFNDDFSGLNPKIEFTVPSPGKGSQVAKKYVIHVADFYGSLLAPPGNLAPRVPTPAAYRLDASITPAASAAASFARGLDPDRYYFGNSGPNPANPTAKLMLVIPRNAGSQAVKLRIFDVNGRLVRTLVDGPLAAGPHTAVWDGRTDNGSLVSSGAYYARLSVGNAFKEDTRITILK